MRMAFPAAGVLLAPLFATACVPVRGGEGTARERRPAPPAAKEVRALLKQLEEKDAKRRDEAARRIVEIAMDFPGEVLPGLPVDASEPEVRKRARAIRTAFEILGERGGVGKFTDDEFRSAMEALDGVRREAARRLLAVKANRTRQAVMQAIYERGWKDLVPLAAERAVADPDAVVRISAFGILQSSGDPAHLRSAILGLKDGDTTVRRTAQSALDSLMGSPKAGEELSTLLGDREAWVRRHAAEAIGKGRDRARAPALLARMEAERDDEVKRALFAAIDRLVGGEAWSPAGAPPELQEVRAWWERNRRKFR